MAGINKDTNDAERFREHFIDICGYRRTDASGGFDNVCKVLEDRTFGGTKSVSSSFLLLAETNRYRPDQGLDHESRLPPSANRRGKSSREPPTPQISVLDC